MKKKVVVKVAMRSERCRTKAKKIAAATEGVPSLTLDSEAQDKLVVTGEGFDPIQLAKKLRKKVGYTDLITVEKEEEKKVDEETKEPQSIPCYCQYQPISYLQYPHYESRPSIPCYYEYSPYEYESSPSCSIM